VLTLYLRSIFALSLNVPTNEQPKVWVCCNRWCRERGASIPLGAAIALTAGQDVTVAPHRCFGRCTIGPNVAALNNNGTVLEYHRVDSVEKISAILSRLGTQIDWHQAQSLEFSVQAGRVAEKQPELAIAAHTAAIETGREDQAAVALVGRAEARLSLASTHADRIARRIRSLRQGRSTNKYLIRSKIINFFATTLSVKKNEPFLSNENNHDSLNIEKENHLIKSTNEWWNLSNLKSVLTSEGAKIRRRASASIAALRFRRQDVVALASPATIIAVKALAEDLLYDDATIAALEFHSKMFEIEVRRALDDALQAAKLLPSYARVWRVASQALTTIGADQATAHQFSQLATDLDLASSDQDYFNDADDDEDDEDDYYATPSSSSQSTTSNNDKATTQGEYDDEDLTTETEHLKYTPIQQHNDISK